MEPRPRGRGNSSRSPLLACRCFPFNGAPTSRPGKLNGYGAKAAAGWTLQWSPDLAAGETHTPAMGNSASASPSMEPRPRGRGNPGDGSSLCRETCPLQWSPDLAAGETINFTGEGTRGPLLQWSPDLAAGETRASPAIRQVRKDLQWSPDLAAGETPRDPGSRFSGS